MKRSLLVLLLPVSLHGQIARSHPGGDTTLARIDWNNYSTSFQGDGKEGSHPVLVTAIPYNGIYGGASYGSAVPGKLPSIDSLYGADEKRPRYFGESYTIDSGNVYFLAPGIHPSNADRYRYRVILDGKDVLVPWSPITQFVDSGQELNEFKPNYGILGGYKTTWGHSILVDIRETATKTIESSAIVYWRSAHASLSAVYTSKDIGHYLASKKPYGDWAPDSTVRIRLHQLEKDSLQLQPGENTLIFSVRADIYQRQALEFQLLRDGAIDSAWRTNNFDNNIVFLQNLPPGNYTLQLRLRAQRHNITPYSFSIHAAWYETKFFQFLLGALEAAALGAVVLLIILVRQRRKTRREKAAREKLDLELGYIRSQLNPHFIFNALNSIQGLINNKDQDAANRYLSDFGQLLRDSLAVSEKDTIPLSQEIRILDTYLLLEQLRFGFRYEIVTTPDLPAAMTEIPAFLLQPLVENAVKHGVSGQRSEGMIRIIFSRENANFIAGVTDNGKGWEAGAAGTRETVAAAMQETVAGTAGYGLRLTRERIDLLNQLSPHQRIQMTIDAKPGAGVTIRLQFSNWWS